MKKSSLILILLALFISAMGNVPTATAVVDEWHINAGGNEFTDSNGITFAADQLYEAGSYGVTAGRSYSFTTDIAGTEDDELYQTLRNYLDFAYMFDIPNGDYEVTVHLMDPWSTAAGQRLMDVTIEDVIVLDNFDTFDAAGGQFTAYAQTFSTTVTDGTLNVDFNRVLRTPMVSAVSVVSSAPSEPEPEISVTPTALDFGDVEIGNSNDLTIEIANDGTADLNIASLTSDNGAFTVESPTAPFVIAPGNSETVTMRFTPTVAGAESGSLQIASDDVNEAVVTVALDGNGTTPPPNEPEINVAPMSLDFGTVIPGGVYTQTVSIENVGLQDLNISSISTSGSPFSVAFSAPTIIAPNSSETAYVMFDSTTEGSFSGTLDIVSDDADEGMVSVSLTAVSADMPSVAYRLNAGGSAYTTIDGRLFEADKEYTAGDFGYSGNTRAFSFGNDIANTDDDALYQSLRSNFSFSYLFDLADGDYNVTLYFMEPFQSAVGERLFDVSIEGSVVLDDYDIFAAAGGQYTAVSETIPVTVADGQLNIDFSNVSRSVMVAGIEVVGGAPAEPAPEITVDPLSLDFGNVISGTTQTLDITITNDGSLDLTITDISSTDSHFVVTSATAGIIVAPGGSTAVSVEFAPSDVTAYTGSLDIASNDADEPTVTVALSGNGTPEPADEPDISLSDTALDFGTVTINESADVTLTVNNDGLQSLTVSAMSTDNGLFTVESPIAPLTIAAGDSEEVTLRFSPTAVGEETAVLTINSDDPDEATVTVSLTGSGGESVPELNVFDWSRAITTQHRGFPNNTPPRENYDYTGTPNYAEGTLYFRAEVVSQPVAQQDMQIQLCYWQELNGDNFGIENCGSLETVAGVTGNVVCWKQPLKTMWKLNGRPIDWSRPRYRIGLAIKNGQGDPVSNYNGWNWNGEDPNEWYPLELNFTAMLVAEGQTFSGYSDCTID